MDNNLISLNQHILKQDLEAFSQALFKQNIALQIENEKLKEKLAHLEELLKNVNVPMINSRHIVDQFTIANLVTNQDIDNLYIHKLIGNINMQHKTNYKIRDFVEYKESIDESKFDGYNYTALYSIVDDVWCIFSGSR